MHRIVDARRARLRDQGRQQRLARPGPPDRGRRPRQALHSASPTRGKVLTRSVLPASCRRRLGHRPPSGSRAPPTQAARPTVRATPRPASTFSTPIRGPRPRGVAGRGRRRAARRGRRRRPAGHAGHPDRHAHVQVTQQGEFSYTGTAERARPTPTGVIATGDTVWTRLSSGLTVSFTDTVSGPGLADLRGAVRLDVAIAAADGWSAVVTRGPVVALRNGTATAAVPVDVPRAAALLAGTTPRSARPAAPRRSPSRPVVDGDRHGAGRPSPPARRPRSRSPSTPPSLRLAGDADAALAPSTHDPGHGRPRSSPRAVPCSSLSVPIGLARLARRRRPRARARRARRRGLDRPDARAATPPTSSSSGTPPGSCRSPRSTPGRRSSTSPTPSPCTRSPSGSTRSCCTTPARTRTSSRSATSDATYRFVVPGGPRGPRPAPAPSPRPGRPEPADVHRRRCRSSSRSPPRTSVVRRPLGPLRLATASRSRRRRPPMLAATP